jgi:hypothetical protein
VLACVAFGMALHRAWGTGFWFDETYTARLAELSLTRAVHGALLDVHPPTWTIIEWLFTRLPLEPEIALRLPSVLAYAALVGFVARRNVLAGLALLFHLPLLDFAAQARAYALLALGITLLPAVVETRRWWLVGLFAGFVGSLHGAGPGLALVALVACIPWREVRPADVAIGFAAAALPQVWWVIPWMQRASGYVDKPWYPLSTASEWTTPTDGWLGLVFLLAAAAWSRVLDLRAAGAAMAILAVLFLAELGDLPMDVRKLGVVLPGLLVLAVDAGPRRHGAGALMAVGFYLSSRHIDERPDLREAADAVARLPRMPVVGYFASELRYYVRRPGPLWAKERPADTAERVREVFDAHGADCMAGVHVWDTAPDDELGPGLQVVAWADVTGMDVRVYGTERCRLDPVPAGWRVGHPCEDDQMRRWLCGDDPWQ